MGVKKICKTAWLCGSETFTPTFASSLETEKKTVEASYFEICELRNSTFFEASVYRSARYWKNSILTNRTKTKSWGDNLRNGRMCNAWIMNQSEALKKKVEM